MEPLQEKKMDELIELERENNELLRKMRRSMVWGQLMTVLYWLFIIGGIGWAYYHFQPYIVKYMSVYETIVETIGNLDAQSRSLPEDLKGFFGGGTPAK